MKNLFKLSASVYLLGILFKFMHWPNASYWALGAMALLLAGLVGSMTQKKPLKLLHVLQAAGWAVWAGGMLFKWMHWPGANILAFSGVAMLAAYIGLGGWKDWQPIFQKAFGSVARKTVLGLTLVVTVAAISFKVLHWPLANVLILIGHVLWIVWFWLPASLPTKPRLRVLDEEL